MRLTDRIFKWGLTIVVIVAIGTGIFVYNHQLEEPIIIKTYEDWYLGLSDDSYVALPNELVLISNAEEDVQIASLSLIDTKGREYSVIPHLQERGFRAGRYKTQNLFLEIRLYEYPFEEDMILVNQFRIKYGDGKESIVDIGSITMYKEESSYNFLKPLGGGANSSEQFSENMVTEDFVVEAVEFIQSGKFNDDSEIYINDIPIDEIINEKFEMGDLLKVENRNKNENDNTNHSVITDTPKLIVKDNKGDTHEIYMNLRTIQMNGFRYFDLIEYVKFLGV